MNTADYLLERGRDDDIAIIANTLQYTYADLRQASARLVAEMLAQGAGPTDRVGILGNNSLFWVAAYLAALKLGAVAVPFATMLTTESVNAMQAFANCRLILAEKRTQRRFAAAFPAELPMIFDDILHENARRRGRLPPILMSNRMPHSCSPAAQQESHVPCASRIATFRQIPRRLSSISISVTPIG